MSASNSSLLCVELAQTYTNEENVLREAQAIMEFIRERKARDPRSFIGAPAQPESGNDKGL